MINKPLAHTTDTEEHTDLNLWLGLCQVMVRVSLHMTHMVLRVILKYAESLLMIWSIKIKCYLTLHNVSHFAGTMGVHCDIKYIRHDTSMNANMYKKNC